MNEEKMNELGEIYILILKLVIYLFLNNTTININAPYSRINRTFLKDI